MAALTNQNKPDYKFWALVVLAAIMAFLACTSCMTNRKGELTEKGKNFIALHCKGKDSVNVSDNTTIMFDTIKVPYPVKGETVYLQSPCDSLGNLKPVNVTTKKNGIKASVKSIGNVLAIDCGTDSLTLIIEKQKRVISEFKGEKTVIEKPCDKQHLSGWDWFWIKLGYILSGFMALQVLIKIITSVYPVTKPFLGWAYLFRF